MIEEEVEKNAERKKLSTMHHNDSDRTKRRKIVSIVKSTVENISSNSSSVTINSVVNASSVVEVNETNEIVNDNLVYSFTLSNEVNECFK